MTTNAELEQAALVTMGQLLAHGLTLATAESMTAGGFHYYCTTVPNCSPSMLGGAVVYSPQSKTVLAGVPTSLLEEFGTVAPETSLSLASGIRDRLRSDIGMGVTGYAGPTGGTAEHPVGRVYWALMAKGAHRLQAYDIPGDRSAVVRGAIKAGFDLLRGFLASEYGIAPERGGDNGGS